MKFFLKEIGRAFFIGVLIFLVVGIVLYINGVRYDNRDELFLRFVFNQVYSVTLYMINAVIFYRLLRRFEKTLFSFKHIVRGITGSLIVSIIAIFFLRLITEVVIYGAPLKAFLANEHPRFYYVSLIITLVIIAIFYGVYYYRHTQERKVKEQKIIAKTASAQFDALKNQLDPHFLFNSLNVLTSLIEENPVAATKFTTALSKVYRYVLEQKNK